MWNATFDTLRAAFRVPELERVSIFLNFRSINTSKVKGNRWEVRDSQRQAQD